MTKTLFSIVLAVSFGSLALAQEKAPNPCKQIAKACEDAGFQKNHAKKGDGLWRHCVNPIMQGQTNVPGATKPLPSVDPNLVQACKTKHPKFGMGKIGSEK